MFDASMPARRVPGSAPPVGAPGWTPEIVEAELIEAARWLYHAGGRAGPLGFVGSRLHDAPLSLHEYIEAFGGPPERADLDDDKEAEREAERLHYRMLPAARLDQLDAALRWPARYVAPRHPDAARALQAWIAAQAGRRGFAPICRERRLNRTVAYRWKDRALSLIAVGLTVSRVPPRQRSTLRGARPAYSDIR